VHIHVDNTHRQLTVTCVLRADQLSRLHMILKPFMLRRVKKDVENELSDKVCIVLCVLSVFFYVDILLCFLTAVLILIFIAGFLL